MGSISYKKSPPPKKKHPGVHSLVGELLDLLQLLLLRGRDHLCDGLQLLLALVVHLRLSSRPLPLQGGDDGVHSLLLVQQASAVNE